MFLFKTNVPNNLDSDHILWKLPNGDPMMECMLLDDAHLVHP